MEAGVLKVAQAFTISKKNKHQPDDEWLFFHGGIHFLQDLNFLHVCLLILKSRYLIPGYRYAIPVESI